MLFVNEVDVKNLVFEFFYFSKMLNSKYGMSVYVLLLLRKINGISALFDFLLCASALNRITGLLNTF